MRNSFSKLKKAWKRYGMQTFPLLGNRLVLLSKIALDNLLYKFIKRQCSLETIFNGKYIFIDFSCGKIQWEGVLVQRYNQIAKELKNCGGLVFVGSLPHVDKVRFIKKIDENIYVVNPYIRSLLKDIENYCMRSRVPITVRVQSTDFSISWEDIKNWQGKGFKILYEFVDPFDPLISGYIPPFILERHKKIIEDESIFFFATAESLLSQVPPTRKNAFLSPNGVNLSHWASFNKNADVPPLSFPRRIVLGYHGALANWLDYELLTKIAQTDKYTLLLIGPEYDNSLKESGLTKYETVMYLGPISHDRLPVLAQNYDISILPFTTSSLSDGVSPIKLFEYMALGRPILTTSSKEVVKYKSCIVVKNAEDFLEKIPYALSMADNNEYLEILRTEAAENDWNKRARDLLQNCSVPFLNQNISDKHQK